MRAILSSVLPVLAALAFAAPAHPQSRPTFAGPPDWSAFKLHVDRAKAAAGTLWATEQTYFCLPGQRADTDHDPPIEPQWLFDNLAVIGNQGTAVYVVTTPAGVVLIDSGRAQHLQSQTLPGLVKLGLDPAAVRYVLITQGWDDHYGGAQWFQQHGARIVIAAKDWDMIAGFPAAQRPLEPRRDMVAEDGKPIVIGGMAFTPVDTPGQSPGALGWIFPVTDAGQTRMAGLFGASILRADRRPPEQVRLHADGLKRWGQFTTKSKIEVELQNHPFFDDMWERAAKLRTRTPGEPNPFVVGTDGYRRFVTVMDECLRATIARKGGMVGP